MGRANEIVGHMNAAGKKFAIVVSRWNAFITERLLEGAAVSGLGQQRDEVTAYVQQAGRRQEAGGGRSGGRPDRHPLTDVPQQQTQLGREGGRGDGGWGRPVRGPPRPASSD